MLVKLAIFFVACGGQWLLGLAMILGNAIVVGGRHFLTS